MTPKVFAIFTAVLALLYALACFWFKEPFWGITSIFVGAMATAYPLYFDHQRVRVISLSQLAQFLAEGAPPDRGNSVFRRKLAAIKEDMDGIQRGIVPLSYAEISAYSESRLREIVAMPDTPSYWTTHFVNSERSLKVWRPGDNTYKHRQSYVAPQKEVVMRGGEIIRIFVIEPTFFERERKACMEMLAAYDAEFAQAGGGRAQTRILIRVPGAEDLEEEIALLNNREAFLWKPAPPGAPETHTGGRYVVEPTLLARLMEQWSRIRTSSWLLADYAAADTERSIAPASTGPGLGGAASKGGAADASRHPQ